MLPNLSTAITLNSCNTEYIELSPSQLTVLRSESASVQTLRGTVEALEQEKAKLQERVQRLEKDRAQGPNVNTSSGDGGLNLVAPARRFHAHVVSL